MSSHPLPATRDDDPNPPMSSRHDTRGDGDAHAASIKPFDAEDILVVQRPINSGKKTILCVGDMVQAERYDE